MSQASFRKQRRLISDQRASWYGKIEKAEQRQWHFVSPCERQNLFLSSVPCCLWVADIPFLVLTFQTRCPLWATARLVPACLMRYISIWTRGNQTLLVSSNQVRLFVYYGCRSEVMQNSSLKRVIINRVHPLVCAQKHQNNFKLYF